MIVAYHEDPTGHFGGPSNMLEFGSRNRRIIPHRRNRFREVRNSLNGLRDVHDVCLREKTRVNEANPRLRIKVGIRASVPAANPSLTSLKGLINTVESVPTACRKGFASGKAENRLPVLLTISSDLSHPCHALINKHMLGAMGGSRVYTRNRLKFSSAGKALQRKAVADEGDISPSMPRKGSCRG